MLNIDICHLYKTDKLMTLNNDIRKYCCSRAQSNKIQTKCYAHTLYPDTKDVFAINK